MKSTIKLIRVSPDLAKEWLKNHTNETLDMSILYKYVEEIEKEGTLKWRQEHPVMYHGRQLLNGHHRLMAITLTDVSVDMYVEVL